MTRGRRDRVREQFVAFAEAVAPTLLRAAELLLGDTALAEDAVQTTLLRVFRHWGRAQENPAAYSRTVLVNVCRDHFRQRSRRPTTVALEDHWSFAAPDPLSRLEDRAFLNDLMAQLSEGQREILVLRFYLDLSVEETSGLLGLPEGTVKSYTSRALAIARRALPEAAKEGDPCLPMNN